MGRAKSEYARSQYEEDSDVELSDYYEEDGGGGDSGGDSSPAPSGDNATYIKQVDDAMQQVQSLHGSSDWKRMLKHKSGVQVFVQKGSSGGKKIPIFKGEGVIKGYSPASVFAVVGTRKLWDEWYEEGNLVENLNDTSSLTYMCMKGIVGSSTRDLSLAEKVEGTSSGAIFFCSTSIDTPRVPKVSGRTRAQIKLNGWVLEPTRVSGDSKPATKITYYLQVDVKTFVPAAFSSRYLARRPLCITKVDNYLQANGAPPMAGVDSAETEAGQGGGKGGRGMSVTSIDKDAAAAAGGGAIAGGGSRSRRGSVSSKRSARSVRSSKSESTMTGIAMPAHVTADESASSYGEIQKAKDLFKKLLSESEGGKWTSAQDRTGARIFLKDQKSSSLPIVKGEASISGVSTEQVLMTVLSQAAARIWDDRLGERTLLDGHNGHDQGIYLETQKAIFPHYEQRYFVCARGVERDDHTADHGQITAVARSIEHKHNEDGQGIKAKLDVSGWSVEPVDDEVHLVHIVQADLGGDKPNSFCYRILNAGTGSGPRKIHELIEEHGFAPGFVRWGQGEAELISDDGDLERGEAEWKVASGGSKAKGGEQIAWFQWSEKMYPNGLALNVEPANAATIAKVEGLPRTLQFTWNKVSKDGVRIAARREKNGNEDSATVNGKKVRDSVAPPAGGGGAGMKKRGPSKKKPQPNGDAAKSDEKKSEPNGDAKKSGAAGAAAAGAGAGAGIGAALSKAAGPVAPGRAANRDDGKVPRNAMIIINDDLYFTRAQVGFIFLLVGLAWAYGRFA